MARLLSKCVGSVIFSIGTIAAMRHKSIFAADGIALYLIPICIITLVTCSTYPNLPEMAYLSKIGMLFSIVIGLYATKFIASSSKLSDSVLSVTGSSFFVFSAHEPLLTILRKVLYVALHPTSSYLILALYFAIPAIVITFAVLVHRLLLRYFPIFTSVITGGR